MLILKAFDWTFIKNSGLTEIGPLEIGWDGLVVRFWAFWVLLAAGIVQSLLAEDPIPKFPKRKRWLKNAIHLIMEMQRSMWKE